MHLTQRSIDVCHRLRALLSLRGVEGLHGPAEGSERSLCCSKAGRYTCNRLDGSTAANLIDQRTGGFVCLVCYVAQLVSQLPAFAFQLLHRAFGVVYGLDQAAAVAFQNRYCLRHRSPLLHLGG